MVDRIEALRIFTRCATVDALIAEWEPYVDREHIFIPHTHVRGVGTEVAFSLRLADKTAVLRGAGIVRDAWVDDANPFGRPGMRIAISRIAPQSRAVFARLAPRECETGDKTVPAAVYTRHLETEREKPLPKPARHARPPLATLRGMRPVTRPGEVPILVVDHHSSVGIAVGVGPLLWRWWFGVVAFALVVAMLLLW